jgi:methylase of polypeptide subunit release factors
MATIERLVRDSAPVLVEGGLLAVEVDSLRADQVAEFVRSVNSFTNVSTERDLTGRDRFVFATRENI